MVCTYHGIAPRTLYCSYRSTGRSECGVCSTRRKLPTALECRLTGGHRLFSRLKTLNRTTTGEAINSQKRATPNARLHSCPTKCLELLCCRYSATKSSQIHHRQASMKREYNIYRCWVSEGVQKSTRRNPPYTLRSHKSIKHARQ